ncbi:hypothetical protein RBS60_11620 [Sinomonas sp. ASV486]|uniref:hypothetical protein n=1 Tax=Sinomonas sp. ASV486 TaxID=3051170 RepID=UPI0027DDA18C|nr:hypothetical protein [Sinomonas sp. ASV486]MDQ4490842.1 hypothetical protein [Sinomonas sp. ASV486]
MKKPRALGLILVALACASAACSAPAAAPATPGQSAQSASSASGAAGAATGWALVPANGAANIKAAGLEVLTSEGSAEHYHAHLDVYSDGSHVPVPADIGFSFGADGQPNGISALHTHDTTGIVHVEAPVAGLTYTVGQVLTEWGVLGSNGSMPGSTISEWSVYINGAKQSGDPRSMVLAGHAEIALVHGSAPADLPASYTFPSGY